MTARQLMAWEAYFSLEPIGEDRLDWLFAGVREMIYTTATHGKHPKPVKDFLLKFGERKKTQTVEDQLFIMQMWADSCNVLSGQNHD